MTQQAPLAVGLDIGTTKIVAVVGRMTSIEKRSSWHRKKQKFGRATRCCRQYHLDH